MQNEKVQLEARLLGMETSLKKEFQEILKQKDEEIMQLKQSIQDKHRALDIMSQQSVSEGRQVIGKPPVETLSEYADILSAPSFGEMSVKGIEESQLDLKRKCNEL